MGITHEWNGTILTITSDSGTSSADLKGAKGDDGARGAQGAAGIVDYSLVYTKATPPTAAEVGAITEDELASAIAAIDVDLSDYYTKLEVDTMTTGLATEEFVSQKIAEAQLDGEDIDLSAYYTKGETDTAIETAINGINIPEADMSNYYTKEEVDTALENLDIPEAEVDLTNYYTKGETDLAIQAAIDSLEVNEDGTISNSSLFTLLWSNTAPTANFEAQTIEADFSSYDFIMVRYKALASSTSIYNEIVKVGDTTNLTCLVNANNYTVATQTAMRTINTSTSNIVFGAGYNKYTNELTGAENNNRAIPIAIYGISRTVSGSGGSGKAVAYNLLDNSYFVNPINQRGQTSYSGAGYYIDRWRSWFTDVILTINSGYITISGSNVVQYIQMPEKTITAYGKKTDGTIVKLNSGYDSSLACHYVELPVGEWIWAAAYEGEYTLETLPEYVYKGYAAELLECQRYYERIEVREAQTSAVSFYLCRDFVRKRIVPTITFTQTYQENISSDLSAWNVSNTSFAAVASQTTANKQCVWYGNVDISADL